MSQYDIIAKVEAELAALDKVAGDESMPPEMAAKLLAAASRTRELLAPGRDAGKISPAAVEQVRGIMAGLADDLRARLDR